MKHNPVAKHCRTFNKATVQRDRTKFHRPSNTQDQYWEDYWREDEKEFDEKEWETPNVSKVYISSF